ncbi:MAG: glutathione peroxidase [Pirellulaceae bacterium]|nr:glutathione peroxidase [Pirellulaceae bacterium]
MQFRLAMLGVVLMAIGNSVGLTADASTAGSIYDHKIANIDDKPVELSQYKGKVLVIVNVASKCGKTPQYEGLQALHEKFKDKGLAILGMPCNQFGKQEPGSNKEIQEFCTSKYHVTFDMFSKIDVNGKDASPLYKQLTALDTKPKGAGPVAWNFEKFIVNRKGEVVARFGSGV